MYEENPKPYYNLKDIDQSFNDGFWFGMTVGSASKE
jgi:hypothetical protein